MLQASRFPRVYFGYVPLSSQVFVVHVALPGSLGTAGIVEGPLHGCSVSRARVGIEYQFHLLLLLIPLLLRQLLLVVDIL